MVGTEMVSCISHGGVEMFGATVNLLLHVNVTSCKKSKQIMSHPSIISWEQCTYRRLAPSEMKLRGGICGIRTLDLET